MSLSMASALALVLTSALGSVGMALGQLQDTSAPHSPNPANSTMQTGGHRQGWG